MAQLDRDDKGGSKGGYQCVRQNLYLCMKEKAGK